MIFRSPLLLVACIALAQLFSVAVHLGQIVKPVSNWKAFQDSPYLPLFLENDK